MNKLGIFVGLLSVHWLGGCDASSPKEAGASENPAPESSEPDPEPQSFVLRNDGDAPLLVNAYPGFTVSRGGDPLPRWTCAAQCGVCDFGECGCAPDRVEEVQPGETLELQWQGAYWEEQDGCDEGCAVRRNAPAGTMTLSLEYGTASEDRGGCAGEALVGEVRTLSVEFEHPSAHPIEVVLPTG